jgi:predicted small secreted protein|tara:strand:- start:157 stop:318 length:162 start_codon:yes stop_codon:yes gene_type:complete
VKYQAKQMNSTSKILKAVFLLGSLIAFSALTSCETISGFGRDLQYASQAAQNR